MALLEVTLQSEFIYLLSPHHKLAMMAIFLSWYVYTYTTQKILEHCNLMSMYLYSKSKIYFSECRHRQALGNPRSGRQ